MTVSKKSLRWFLVVKLEQFHCVVVILRLAKNDKQRN